MMAYRGDTNQGWVAIDDFIFLPAIDDCSIHPPTADPQQTTANPSETTHIPPSLYHKFVNQEIFGPVSAIQCEFETGFCGFEVSGSKTFNFTIEQAGHIIEDGPLMDHNGSSNGHFAYILSESGNTETAQTEMETYMIHGANHLLECFSFWFAIKVKSFLFSLI